jgi:hypothetical protein
MNEMNEMKEGDRKVGKRERLRPHFSQLCASEFCLATLVGESGLRQVDHRLRDALRGCAPYALGRLASRCLMHERTAAVRLRRAG